MDLGEYLYFTRRLTVTEYVNLRIKQNPVAFTDYKQKAATLSSVQLSNIEDLADIRLLPFGHVLQNDSKLANAVAERSGKDLDALVKEWQEWHLKNLEPICTYSLASKVGSELYKRQVEKKLVGLCVAQDYVRDGDNTVIPEGSSALYVGLGIASARQRVRICTSNDPLIRECRDNPAVVRRFRQVDVVGGFIDDQKYSGHGGVFGTICEAQFHTAITEDPGATIVIIPVNGLLPKDGPFAEDGDAMKFKLSTIRDSLASNVRQLIFVADHSKHLDTHQSIYGLPIFRKDEWRRMLEKHLEIIAIVTSPPPDMRRLLAERKLGNPVERQLYTADQAQLSAPDKEYDQTAKEFGCLTRGNGFECKFREAFLSSTPALVPTATGS